ncbi:MAG: hypothetical protein ACXADH_15895 [Candidatus Kariarchaeaceae archaeon]|jgi:hypothetical protein
MCYNRLEFLKESTSLWVGVSDRDPTDELGIRIYGLGKTGLLEVLYANIPGGSWNAQRLKKFQDRVQDEMDDRVPLADLPVDDPDKTTDPALPNLFWDSGDLVSREYIILNLTWSDPAEGGRGLLFRIEKVIH